MKIGFLSMPFSGHLNPMTALARRLQSRGNEVVFIGVPDAEPIVRGAELNFASFCEDEFPVGSIVNGWSSVSTLHGLEVIRHSIGELIPSLTKASMEHLPEKMAATGIDALVLDTTYRHLELVPIHLGVPYAQVWNILHVDRSGSTPPCYFSWPYETTSEALARNKEGLKILAAVGASALAVAKSYIDKYGLKIDLVDPSATISKLAVITQTPKEFDFPMSHWPAQFHYAGPFHDDNGREQVPFPWEKLTGAPLIYASMGTLLNGRSDVYTAILEAVGKFPEVQMVLSIGKNVEKEKLRHIPANAIVVTKAPQIELLKRAALCITHAGLNTTLESLAQGVPMVAIPVGYDQPGVAARIAYHGVGEFIEPEDLSAQRLAELIQRVHKNPSYREKTRYFQKVIAETRGLDVAAGIIEQAFQKNLSKVYA
jgi:zeaxanthin glucosyltransferase